MAGELHLGPRVVATAFQRQHRAFAELVVEHLHARAQAVRRRSLLRRHRRAGEGLLAAAATAVAAAAVAATTRAAVAAAIAESRRGEALVLGREPLERLFRQFLEEA